MKKILPLLVTLAFAGCQVNFRNPVDDEKAINLTLDSWHEAASRADFTNYFKPMSDDAIYIGTDATENWNKEGFMVWAKPYFDKGKAWSFTKLDRNIYFDKTGKIAWFDELLNTQMKICRGSGVMVKVKGEWKIQHYVLSMTIPNDLSNEVIRIKSVVEDEMISGLQNEAVENRLNP